MPVMVLQIWDLDYDNWSGDEYLRKCCLVYAGDDIDERLRNLSEFIHSLVAEHADDNADSDSYHLKATPESEDGGYKVGQASSVNFWLEGIDDNDTTYDIEKRVTEYIEEHFEVVNPTKLDISFMYDRY